MNRSAQIAVLGIDPGKSGGLALVRDDDFQAQVWKMPETEADLWELFCQLKGLATFAYLEHVHAMPKQGVSSTFKFGVQYGSLRMALIASGIPFENVTPYVWQKSVFGTKTKGDKNFVKRAAQERYPYLKITHAIADALFIARYGWLKQVEETRK